MIDFFLTWFFYFIIGCPIVLSIFIIFGKESPYNMQIGPTCGFYCTAYISQRLRNNGKKPSSGTLHKTVYNLIRKTECNQINGRPISYVGEIFDINTLNRLVMDTLPDGYASQVLKFDLDTFYKSQNCLYYIVPILRETPHFVVIEDINETKAKIWNPNSFRSHKTCSPNELLDEHKKISNTFDWCNYVNNIIPKHKKDKAFGRKIVSILSFKDFVELINSKEENCVSANSARSKYDDNMNLNGYIIGISKSKDR